MIFALGVALELVAIEVDIAEIAGGVALRFIVEVLGLRMAAFASARDCPGAHAVPELHHGDEAVPAGAVPLLRAWVGARAERGERAPLRRCEGDRHARLRVVKRLNDIAG